MKAHSPTEPYIHRNTQKYTEIHTHTQKYTEIRTNTHKYAQIRTNMHKYAQIRTNTYKYAQIHTHTHTYTILLQYCLEIITCMFQSDSSSQHRTVEIRHLE